jgi:hypothetical protein
MQLSRRVWQLLAVVLLLVGLVVFAGLRLLAARVELIRGADELRAARTLVSPISRFKSASTRLELRADLAAANRDFAATRSDIGPWRGLLDQLGWIPRVGGQLEAAPAAADTAFFATRGALALLDGLSPIWPVVTARPGGGRTTPGPLSLQLLPLIRAAQPRFAASLADVRQAGAALRRLPPRTGSASLDSAAARLREMLPVLDSGLSWLLVTPRVFGFPAPAHYLVLVQNPAELRATGGFIGAVDLISADRGRLAAHFANSALTHEIASVPAPLPEAFYTPEGIWLFRDANFSPDYPLSARLARWFYGEDTGRWTDGVIAVTDTTITHLLAATGPVYLPAYRRWASAANASELATLYVLGTSTSSGGGKQFLAAVIAALLSRLESLPLDRWQSVAEALSHAVSRRDIQLYDRRAAVQRVIAASGATGSLTYPGGDFLYVVDDNRSYNKINPYVRQSAQYAAHIFSDRHVQVTLQIHYHVLPSPAGLFGAGPDLGLGGSKHDYEDFVRIYVPPGSRLLDMAGVDRWPPAPAYGLTQFAGRLLLREGQSCTVTLRYVVPSRAIVLSSQASSAETYRLTIVRQPGADLRAVDVRVAGPALAAAPALRTLPLTSSTTAMSLPLHATAPVVVQPLPTSAASVDPYIPFGSLRDPRHPL